MVTPLVRVTMAQAGARVRLDRLEKGRLVWPAASGGKLNAFAPYLWLADTLAPHPGLHDHQGRHPAPMVLERVAVRPDG